MAPLRLLAITILLLPFVGLSQSISGRIVNSSSGNPIPYATVAYIKKNNGINADSWGNFNLNVPGFQGDSLRISCVGYRAKVFYVEKAGEGLTFQLEQLPSLLPDVKIHARANSITLDPFSRCRNDVYTSMGHVTQIAKLFHSDVADFSLFKILICKEPVNATFRIRIYDVDTVTGKPLNDLTTEVIEVRSRKKMVEVDLSKYFITPPRQDFFIAIEWLFIPENLTKSRPLVKRSKGPSITYEPSIGLAEGRGSSWSQHFNTKWYRDHFYDFLISVELKY